MQKTVTLKANSQQAVDISGKHFGVISCTSAFTVEPDRGGVKNMSAGRKFGGERFERLLFRETAGAENTIIYEAGDDEILIPVNPDTTVNVAVENQSTVPADDLYNIQADDTVEQIFPGGAAIYVTQIEFFAASDVVAGIPVANITGDVSLGQSAGLLPYKRTVDDVGFAVIFKAPTGQKIPLSSFYIKGKEGDGVAFTYIPA